MNIAFIGARGVGKTTLARRVACHFHRSVWDLDDLIVYEELGKAIPEIVNEKGWSYFREVEYRVVDKLSSFFTTAVFACGGGVVTDLDDNGNQIFSCRKVNALRRSSYIVWLRAPLSVLRERISEDFSRPSLTGEKTVLEEMEEILALRSSWYEQASDIVFDTSVMSEGDIIRALEPVVHGH